MGGLPPIPLKLVKRSRVSLNGRIITGAVVSWSSEGGEARSRILHSNPVLCAILQHSW